jgi:hypothetical protein
VAEEDDPVPDPPQVAVTGLPFAQPDSPLFASLGISPQREPPPPPAQSAFQGKERHYEQVYLANSRRFERLAPKIFIGMTADGWLAMAETEGLRLAASASPLGCPDGGILAIHVQRPSSSQMTRCSQYSSHAIVRVPKSLGSVWERSVAEATRRLGVPAERIRWWVVYPRQTWNAIRGVILDRLGEDLEMGDVVEVFYVRAQDGRPDVLVFRSRE